MAGLIDPFIDYLVSQGRSAHTLRAYKSDLNAYELAHPLGRARGLGGKRVSGIASAFPASPKVLLEFISGCAKAGNSPATIKRRLASLGAFFEWAVLNGSIESNPIHKIKYRPSKESGEPEALTPEDMTAMFNTAPHVPELERTGFVLETLYWTGLRISELKSINRGSVRGSEIRVKGKGKKWRSVPIPKGLADQLRANAGKGLAFPESQDTIRRGLKKLGEAAGLDSLVHPHLIRRTFATVMLKRGTDIRTIQKYLGHSSLATTQVYLKTTDDDMRDAMSNHPLAEAK